MIIASPDWAFNGAFGGYAPLMRDGGQELMTTLWIIDTEDDEWDFNNPCGHVDNCIVCYPNAPGYSGFDHYSYWWECAEMGMEY
jgi:hypothetical protein